MKLKRIIARDIDNSVIKYCTDYIKKNFEQKKELVQYTQINVKNFLDDLKIQKYESHLKVVELYSKTILTKMKISDILKNISVFNSIVDMTLEAIFKAYESALKYDTNLMVLIIFIYDNDEVMFLQTNMLEKFRGKIIAAVDKDLEFKINKKIDSLKLFFEESEEEEDQDQKQDQKQHEKVPVIEDKFILMYISIIFATNLIMKELSAFLFIFIGILILKNTQSNETSKKHKYIFTTLVNDNTDLETEIYKNKITKIKTVDLTEEFNMITYGDADIYEVIDNKVMLYNINSDSEKFVIKYKRINNPIIIGKVDDDNIIYYVETEKNENNAFMIELDEEPKSFEIIDDPQDAYDIRNNKENKKFQENNTCFLESYYANMTGILPVYKYSDNNLDFIQSYEFPDNRVVIYKLPKKHDDINDSYCTGNTLIGFCCIISGIILFSINK